MKTFALFWSFAFVVYRAVRIYGMFASGAVLPICFGVSESLALLATLYALRFGVVDSSLWGFFVPLLHLTAVLFDFSNPSGPDAAAGLYLLLCPLQWALRLRMGVRCTVGVPVFVSLLDRWPYSMLRHPLAALEIVLCSCAALWAGGSVNTCIWFVHVACCVACVLCEERFLRGQPSYISYCDRVPWRLIPGVW